MADIYDDPDIQELLSQKKNPFVNTLNPAPAIEPRGFERAKQLVKKGATFGMAGRDVNAEGFLEHALEFGSSIPTAGLLTGGIGAALGASAKGAALASKLGPTATRMLTAATAGGLTSAGEAAVSGKDFKDILVESGKGAAWWAGGEGAFLAGAKALRGAKKTNIPQENIKNTTSTIDDILQAESKSPAPTREYVRIPTDIESSLMPPMNVPKVTTFGPDISNTKISKTIPSPGEGFSQGKWNDFKIPDSIIGSGGEIQGELPKTSTIGAGEPSTYTTHELPKTLRTREVTEFGQNMGTEDFYLAPVQTENTGATLRQADKAGELLGLPRRLDYNPKEDKMARDALNLLEKDNLIEARRKRMDELRKSGGGWGEDRITLDDFTENWNLDEPNPPSGSTIFDNRKSVMLKETIDPNIELPVIIPTNPASENIAQIVVTRANLRESVGLQLTKDQAEELAKPETIAKIENIVLPNKTNTTSELLKLPEDQLSEALHVRVISPGNFASIEPAKEASVFVKMFEQTGLTYEHYNLVRKSAKVRVDKLKTDIEKLGGSMTKEEYIKQKLTYVKEELGKILPCQ